MKGPREVLSPRVKQESSIHVSKPEKKMLSERRSKFISLCSITTVGETSTD